MTVFESLSPSGDTEQRPYARALIGLLIGAVLSNMLSAPAISIAFGLWPFVVTQLALLWIWYALSVRRLHNAERSVLGVTAVALIALIAIALLTVILMLQAVDAEPTVAGPWLPASIGGLIYPVVFLYNLVTGPSANPQDTTVAILSFFSLAPLLLLIWYSVWAALQPSELHATEPLP